MRRQARQLPADRAGLELHGTSLSSAPRSAQRQMGLPEKRAHVVIAQVRIDKAPAASLAGAADEATHFTSRCPRTSE
ncbi:hypothetical protein BN2476_70097 [Paraburkholderia piptadeniae]|uniref:Uncharacterized protein n=1 Tax=Paraburkholderia piptadeniae TaxID=1701573 RepID=A0A1N7RLG7_9BURK|nr:hypothetical protein BN2476_70097 [Paraburkholderia piptadeniae]